MPFLNDLITVLSGDEVAVYGTDLFLGSLADIPALPVDSGTYMASGAVIGIIETGGTNPEYTQNNVVTPSYLKPSAQISVEAAEDWLAEAIMDRVYYSLCKVRNQMINSNWYRWIKPLSQPADPGGSKRGQARRVLNITADFNRRENV